MKKLLFMLMLITSLSVSATSKDTLNAVTMVSYEQGWIDTKGTLALKNNTNEDIHNNHDSSESLLKKTKTE